MSAGLTWNGDAIARRAQRASVEGIDETTEGARDVGRQLVHVDTHLLQSRIESIPARATATGATGAFGVPDDPGYALPQEDLPEPRGKPYLHPSADQEFPKLASRIARRFRG